MRNTFIPNMSSSMWNYTYLFSFWVLSSSVVCCLSIYFSGTAVIHSFVLFNCHSSGMHCPNCVSHICLQTTSLHVQWKLWLGFKKRDLTSLSSLIFWQAKVSTRCVSKFHWFCQSLCDWLMLLSSVFLTAFK